MHSRARQILVDFQNDGATAEAGFDAGVPVPITQPEPIDELKFLTKPQREEILAIIQDRVETEKHTYARECVARVLIELMNHKRPGLQAAAMAIGAGLYATDGKTLTAIAAAHGVTKQALSDRAVKCCQKLGLKPSRGMKSENARESYKAAQLKRAREK